MSTTARGRQAEQAAALYLEELGFKVIERNWRTRWCEIDLIVEKHKTIHFVEVKYRQTNFQGSGLEYITSKKLQQMRFAAEMWVQNRQWRGGYTLSAIEVSGDRFSVTNFLPDCT